MGKFVLKNIETGKYIGIDSNSGGYPYDTDLLSVKIWINETHAKNYADKFPNKQFELHKLIAYTEPIVILNDETNTSNKIHLVNSDGEIIESLNNMSHAEKLRDAYKQ